MSTAEPCFPHAAHVADYIQQHRGKLLGYIEKQLGTRLRSKVEPEDVLQDVSATACRTALPEGMTDEGLFGWLCHLAGQKIVDSHRKLVASQKRAAAREVPLGSPGGDSQNAALVDLLRASFTTASKAFSRNEKEIRLLAAMEKLPEDYRRVLALRYGEGLASKEIAAQIGKSDGSVRVMLTRGLGMLRDQFGPEDRS